MQLEQIVQAALARATEFSDAVPSTRAVLYRRVAARQRQLAARAAEVNPDFLGADDTVAVEGGAADLRELDPTPLQITDVLVAAGAGYPAGTRVALVPIAEPESGLAPRATLRDGVVRGVAGELDAVTSLRVCYARQPDAPEQATDEPELPPAEFHELLVVDLTKQMLAKVGKLAGAAAEALAAEEAELTADFERYLRTYNRAAVSRFAR